MIYDIMLKRRSIRSYEEKPVPRELLEQLTEVGRWAPTAGNLQPCHFYVIQNKAIMKKLFTTALFSNAAWPLEAPACIVIAVDPEIVSQRYGNRGQYLYAVQDGSIAATHMILLAEELGLGTCWIGAFDEQACSEAIGIPDRHTPLAILTIGYPARTPAPTPRKEINEITTWIG